MRLLSLDEYGGLVLTEFLGNDIPPYAILSHTWEPNDGDEPTFKDIVKGRGMDKPGYRKVDFCLEQAARGGLKYCWIDTCCIDKSSSAELTEAINSMFRWYQNAAVCYVHLADVYVNPDEPIDRQDWQEAFERSRWFTRGWTLQELVAPTRLIFFSEEGIWLDDRQSLAPIIHKATSIPVSALQAHTIDQHASSPNAIRSWAIGRRTKREEDAAYSLFGLFDVQLPLIYGEGQEKALSRLDEAIRRAHTATFNSYHPENLLRRTIPTFDVMDYSRPRGRFRQIDVYAMIFLATTLMGLIAGFYTAMELSQSGPDKPIIFAVALFFAFLFIWLLVVAMVWWYPRRQKDLLLALSMV